MKNQLCENGHPYDPEACPFCPTCARQILGADVPERFIRLGRPVPLGTGGTGTVFRFDTAPPVVLKIVRCGRDRDLIMNTERELSFMKMLRGERFAVSLLDSETLQTPDGESFFFLEEYLERLDAYMQRSDQTLCGLCGVMVRVCDAVQALIGHGVYHLDLKLQNLYVDAEGRVHIGDFGVALYKEELPHKRDVRGTVGYIAPEVLIDGRCSEASEIYSLGQIFYRLLNGGKPPYGNDSKGDEGNCAHPKAAPLPPLMLDAPEDLTAQFNSLISRATAVDPERRIQRVADLRAELSVLQEKAAARETDTVVRFAASYSAPDVQAAAVEAVFPADHPNESGNGQTAAPGSPFDVFDPRETDYPNPSPLYGPNYNAPFVQGAMLPDAFPRYSAAPSAPKQGGRSGFGGLFKRSRKKRDRSEKPSVPQSGPSYPPPPSFPRPDAVGGGGYGSVPSAGPYGPAPNGGRWGGRGPDESDFSVQLPADAFDREKTIQPSEYGRKRQESQNGWYEWDLAGDETSIMHPYHPNEAPPSEAELLTAARLPRERPTRQCLFCGKALRSDANFCPYCGSAAPREENKPRFCSTCGSRLFDGDVFCSNCGTSFQRQEEKVRVSVVEFSAVAPKHFVKGGSSDIDIMMYETAARSVVEDLIARSPTPLAEKRSGRLLVSEGTAVTVVLSSRDVAVEDNALTLTWVGSHLNFSFSVFLPEDYAKPTVSFLAKIYFEGVLKTRLSFTAAANAEYVQQPEIDRRDVRSAFISYSHEDRDTVMTLARGMKLSGDIDVFLDVEKLRTGENWETALYREIDRRDILYLCWSDNAKTSEWVNREWRYALRTKGEDGVEPLPIVPPEDCPPPEELNAKHWNDIYLYVIKHDRDRKIAARLSDRITAGNRSDVTKRYDE